MQQLKATDLYRYSKIDIEDFKSGDIDSDSLSFMEQFHPRAYQALSFGLHLRRNQNHIFIMGESGVGRFGLSKSLLKRAAKKKPKPKDVVLVADFSKTNKNNRTQYLYFKAGEANIFKAEIDGLINKLTTRLPSIFNGHSYQVENQKLETLLINKQEDQLDEAFTTAKKCNIYIEQLENNFQLYAVIDDKRVKISELEDVDDKDRKLIFKNVEKVEDALNNALTKFPHLQNVHIEDSKNLNFKFATDEISPLTNKIKLKFPKNISCHQYLDSLQHEIINKLHLFWQQDEQDLRSESNSLLDDGLSVFEVNALIENNADACAPVIYEPNVILPKLFGYTINSAAANTTDTLTLAMNHQAGLLQKAHGGFLMLGVGSILKDPELWASLKTALMSKNLTFEIPSATSVVPYHLPDFPLDVTLVLVGQTQHFYALQDMDAQFERLIKVHVEFGYDVKRTSENEISLARKLKAEIQNWENLPLKNSAYERLLELSARLAENAGKINTNKGFLRDIIAQANAYARAHGKRIITREVIETTIEQRQFHTGMIEDYHHRAIHEKQILISTEGECIGQINGLTVVSFGNQSFGQPVRITAQVSAGDDGVIDIETEIDMSGPIHSKGMLILTGYLRGRFMRQKAYGFTASVVMEQAYDGIEGDSASCAELMALLSSLTQQPLRQDLAVTGAMNQLGVVEPIGGINEKIESFFKICAQNGLTGTQGIIMPKLNQINLMLASEVRQAVKQGKFHIYTVEHVDEIATLLTGIKPGKLDAKGKFTAESFNFKILEAFKNMNASKETP